MSISTRVLVLPEEQLDALVELCGWATSLRLAYAWAHSGGGHAQHWCALPLEKIESAVVGIHFAQTEPLVLRRLHALGVLRVVDDTSGVFHPKLIVGVSGSRGRALVGSSNFTSGGFAGNVELNLLIEGPVVDEPMRSLIAFATELVSSERSFVPDAGWLDRYEAAHAERPVPPRVKEARSARRAVRSQSDLDIDWPTYFGRVAEQERRTLANGFEVHVFEHPDGSWIGEARNCARVFDRTATFAEMEDEDRKLVAGWGRRSSGYFGRMGGAGRFMQLVGSQPTKIGRWLDAIPLRGPVSSAETAVALRRALSERGVGVGAATRLLAVKRPDLFLAVTKANRARVAEAFGFAPTDPETYVELVKAIHALPWWNTPEPARADERTVWRARVALLDALFYEPAE